MKQSYRLCCLLDLKLRHPRPTISPDKRFGARNLMPGRVNVAAMMRDVHNIRPLACQLHSGNSLLRGVSSASDKKRANNGEGDDIQSVK